MVVRCATAAATVCVTASGARTAVLLNRGRTDGTKGGSRSVVAPGLTQLMTNEYSEPQAEIGPLRAATAFESCQLILG